MKQIRHVQNWWKIFKYLIATYKVIAESPSNVLTDLWHHSGWKGPCWAYSPISCSKQGQSRTEIRFLTVLSIWVLKSYINWRVHNSRGPNLNYPVSKFIFPWIQADPPQFQSEHYPFPATVNLNMFCLLLFCLPSFGNNGKIRKAAVEKNKKIRGH